MRTFLIISLIISYLNSSSQYSIDKIYIGESDSDTVYIKDNTDSLFRLVGGEYIYGNKLRIKVFVPSVNVTGNAFQPALGFTPYNATNPNGYISGITSGNVTTALGYTPLNPANNLSDVTAATARTNLGLVIGTNVLAPNGSAALLTSFPTFNQNTTGSAATLTTPRNINGTAFNGSADITITAAAGTLTGTTLNSSVVNSSLTSVGTITTGIWNGTTIAIANGGTGQTTASAARIALLPSMVGNANKYLRVNAGATDYELVTLAGGGDALTSSPLSQFASTTSAQFSGVISNETGTGLVVLDNSPAFTGTPTAPTASLNTNTTQVATTEYVDTKIRTLALTSNATANSTTTGVEITGMNLTVTAGTYAFKYYVVYQAGATSTGIRFGVNHTGTNSLFVVNMSLQESTTAASTGAASQAATGTGLKLVSGSSARTVSTTVPNLNLSISVDAANSNMLAIIEGVIVVTGSGDLELWHASEVAASSQVMAGTSLILTRIN